MKRIILTIALCLCVAVGIHADIDEWNGLSTVTGIDELNGLVLDTDIDEWNQIAIDSCGVDDSYSESNYFDGDAWVCSTYSITSQSFTSTGGELDKVVLYLKKFGAPTGTAVVELFDHSGTYGTSSVPTGAALATSATLDVSTLTTSMQLITFNFTGAERIPLTNTTQYVLTITYSGGDCTNTRILAGHDDSSPTHGGNRAYYDTDWNAQAGSDLLFYVYVCG